MAANCRSVRFRECGLIAWALEWVATSGALLIAATSQKPRSLRCERSIKIRKRLQAPISALPRSGKPGAGVGRGRTGERHAVAERVRPAPDRAERAQPRRVQHVQNLEIRVDRL